MELICNAIKEKRKEMNMTQSQVADELGVCYVSICNLERGKNVSSHLLIKVCKLLGLQLIVKEEN